MALNVHYTHAAPYIREKILTAAGLKLSARTQRDQRKYGGQLHGLILALEIVLRSEDCQGSPDGYPPFGGFDKAKVLAEVQRYLGGSEARMIELGFTGEVE